MSTYSNISGSGDRPDSALPWNNAYDIVSYETYQRFNLLSQCVVKPLLFLVGIPTNIVNCVVFWRQGLGDRMNFCLFCLVLADLLYLLSLLGTSQGTFIELADELLGKEIYYKSLSLGFGIRDEMRTMAGCITLVISIERCICVYLPLHAPSLMKTRNMGVLLASIYVITQLGFVYSFFRYNITPKRSNITNQTAYWILEESWTYRNNYLILRTLQVFLLTILPPCVFISMCIATAATVVKLKSAILWRQKMSSNHRDTQQRTLIRMLVAVSCVYILTSAPYVAVILTSAFVLDFDLGGRFQNSYLTMGVFATLCTALNCSFNFAIYYRHSSRYRHEIEALCCCTDRQKSQDVNRDRCDSSHEYIS